MDKLEGSWSKRTILEPDTGKAYNKYFYKRKPAKRIVIDTPKANALAGYTLIEKDLRSAIIWLEKIISIYSKDPKLVDVKGHIKATYNREEFNIVKGLFVAALTFYGKCFSSCEGRRVKLERSNLDEDFRDDHDSAMEFRHNFAAHSGAKRLEKVEVVIALDPKRKVLPYFTRELIQPDSMSVENLEAFVKLFKHAKGFADAKSETLSEKIYEDDILSKGRDFWENKT